MISVTWRVYNNNKKISDSKIYDDIPGYITHKKKQLNNVFFKFISYKISFTSIGNNINV